MKVLLFVAVVAMVTVSESWAGGDPGRMGRHIVRMYFGSPCLVQNATTGEAFGDETEDCNCTIGPFTHSEDIDVFFCDKEDSSEEEDQSSEEEDKSSQKRVKNGNKRRNKGKGLKRGQVEDQGQDNEETEGEGQGSHNQLSSKGRKSRSGTPVNRFMRKMLRKLEEDNS